MEHQLKSEMWYIEVEWLPEGHIMVRAVDPDNPKLEPSKRVTLVAKIQDKPFIICLDSIESINGFITALEQARDEAFSEESP